MTYVTRIAGVAGIFVLWVTAAQAQDAVVTKDPALDRIEPNGKRTVLADNFEGKKFNGPNDLVVKKNGAIYFTDTFGGLRNGDKDRDLFAATVCVKDLFIGRESESVGERAAD
jgi:sugar lactone lactonase YvrE